MGGKVTHPQHTQRLQQLRLKDTRATTTIPRLIRVTPITTTASATTSLPTSPSATTLTALTLPTKSATALPAQTAVMPTIPQPIKKTLSTILPATSPALTPTSSLPTSPSATTFTSIPPATRTTTTKTTTPVATRIAAPLSSAIEPVHLTTGENTSAIEPVHVTTGENTSAIEPVHVTTGENNSAIEPVHVTTGENTSAIEPVHVTTGENTSAIEPVHVTTGENTSAIEPVHVTTGENTSAIEPVHVTTGENTSAIEPVHGTTGKKNYTNNDPSLKFVNRDDDHDFLCEGFSSRRALMSCGHSVTPQSLTDWCQRQLHEGKTSFECGMPNCSAVWTYKEVCKMALLTEDERSSFEQQMFRNVAFKELNAKICPGCKSKVVRNELNNLCVECPQCSKDKRRDFTFCWQCLREWIGPAPHADHCENEGCVSQALEVLKTCPNIVFSDVRGVSGCPSIRACPTCGLLVQHSGERCKNIRCPDCKVEFCFVCLKITTECLKDSDYFIMCKSSIAPRQTTIPARNISLKKDEEPSSHLRFFPRHRESHLSRDPQISPPPRHFHPLFR